MKKTIVSVPFNIDFISEWTDYYYPTGHCIVDKGVCGCGFTEFCLRNEYPTILCSPRKILLENKEEQHKGDLYYFKNEKEKLLEIDGKTGEFTRGIKKELLEDLDDTNLIENKIKEDYITILKEDLKLWASQRTSNGVPPKILVTYDSLKHVLDALGEYKSLYRIVVDEFQSIFMDSRFKAEVELDFVEYLKPCPNVLYLSATPMLDKYLEYVDYFRELPYYELSWDIKKIEKIEVTRKPVKSIISECSKIIQDYKNGLYPKKILEDKTVYESKEVVFFVNSVRTITEIIKRNSLNKNEVNIICSQDSKNREKLKKIKHDFGKVPLMGEEHKKFTFCTRTTYLGADFYSTNAYTIVCSDANIETLTVDISLDLPQIMGRQRLKENVFRKECLFMYKISKSDNNQEMSEDNYNKYLHKKKKKTEDILRGYGVLDEESKKAHIEKYKRDSEIYQQDFVGVSRKTGDAVYNYLVEISDMRAWEVRQVDYQDNCYLKKTLESEDFIVQDSVSGPSGLVNINLDLQKFIYDFGEETRFDRKMELYCDFILRYYSYLQTTSVSGIPREYQNYMNLLGPEKIKSLGYYQANLEREYKNITSEDKIKEIILKEFQVYQSYTLKDIKEKLKILYLSLSITKTPKAVDIEEYFVVKEILIYDSKKKKQNKGYLLLKQKQCYTY